MLLPFYIIHSAARHPLSTPTLQYHKARVAPITCEPGAKQTNNTELYYTSKTQHMKQSVDSVGHVDGSCVLSKQFVSSV